MKKFQINSAAFKPFPQAQGGLKRTSKKLKFQLEQCDHPRDTNIPLISEMRSLNCFAKKKKLSQL